MPTLILQGPNLNNNQAQALAAQLQGTLNNHIGYYSLDVDNAPKTKQLLDLREAADFDINIVPEDFDAREVGLLISDMDSTLISIECVDEIADFVGIKPEVAAITESAMRGEIDFNTSLIKRVGLLAGLDASALEKVYQERLTLNPGANELLAGLADRGIKTALVSGGFTFFTERLKKRLGLDYTFANVLDIHEGKLTGKLCNDGIVNAEAKAAFLTGLNESDELPRRQTIAIGDGANDLKMMAIADLSIAYHAKPTVQAQAKAVLNHCGLEGVLGLLHTR